MHWDNSNTLKGKMSVRLFEAQINSLLAPAIVILTDPNLSKHEQSLP